MLFRSHTSSDVSLMAQSFVVDEAFPPVSFEEPRKNATVLAHSAFHDPSSRPAGPLGSRLGWLRTAASVSETGVVRLRSASCGTVRVAVHYQSYTSDAFLGQLCSMVLPQRRGHSRRLRVSELHKRLCRQSFRLCGFLLQRIFLRGWRQFGACRMETDLSHAPQGLA